MSDLADHQRKAGSTITPAKSEASRENAEIARARKIELRLMREDYLDALEALYAATDGAKEWSAVVAARDAVTAVKIKMGGKK